MDSALSEAGYTYGGDPEKERNEEGEGEHFESFGQDPVRVVITGIDGRVVRDNSSELLPGATAPILEGHRETVFYLAANQPVG